MIWKMTKKTTKQPFGLHWRLPLYQQYFFYFRTCRNYRQIIRFLQQGQPLDKLYLRNGLELELPSIQNFSLSIFREVWQHRVYLRALTGVSPQYIIDIGAHAGFFTVQAATNWPHAHIIAIEPAPNNYNILERNVKTNNLHNVTLIQAALTSDRSETVEFQLSSQAESHALVGQGVTKNKSDVIQVPTISFEQIFENNNMIVDLLKIDCEGCEYDLIEYAIDRLKTNVRTIIMEYHLLLTVDVQYQLLTPLQLAGFDVQIISKEPSWGLIMASNTKLAA